MNIIPVVIALILGIGIIYYVKRNTDESKFDTDAEKRKNTTPKSILTLAVIGKIFYSIIWGLLVFFPVYGLYCCIELFDNAGSWFILIGSIITGSYMLYKTLFKNEPY